MSCPATSALTNQTAGRTATTERGGRLPTNYSPWVDMPFFDPHVKTHTAAEAYTNVLANVGCNFPALDEHDQRVIAEVRDGTFKFKGSKTGLPGLPDSQDDVGGWEDYPEVHRPADWDTDHDGMPDEWEKAHGLNPSDASRRQPGFERRRLHQPRKIPELARGRVFDAPNKGQQMSTPVARMKTSLPKSSLLKDAQPFVAYATKGCHPIVIKGLAEKGCWLIVLTVFTFAAAAHAQYPRIAPDVQAEASARKAAADKRSDEAFARALPVIKEWEAKGKPYLPGAAKPKDLPQAKIPAFPGAWGGGMYSLRRTRRQGLCRHQSQRQRPGQFSRSLRSRRTAHRRLQCRRASSA